MSQMIHMDQSQKLSPEETVGWSGLPENQKQQGNNREETELSFCGEAEGIMCTM